MKNKLLTLLALPLFIWAEAQSPQPQLDLFNKDQAAFLFSGEFLYWTVNEGALDYAINMRQPAWGPTPSYAQGDMERATFNYDPGYRFSLGYYRAPNFWEATFEWTYIHINGHNRLKRPPASEDRFLTGTWPQLLANPIDHATSHIHLHYQLADFVADRVFHPFDNPHLRLRLLGGLTGVWINQDWKVRYYDESLNHTMINNKWKYWGFGFRAGLGFDWFWGANIYATGRFSSALVMGHYHNHAKQETSVALQAGDDPATPVRDLRYKDYRMAFTTQFLLGPSYQKSFQKWRMEIFLGYEMTLWTNLQEVFRSTSGAPDQAKETLLNTGFVALQGLTTRASFNF